MMKKSQIQIGVGLSVLLASGLAWAANVTSIDFVNNNGASEIDIHSDQPITFDKSENASDKQIVIDLKGTSLSKPASRNMDTSSFDSKVMLISPYSVNDGKDSRVVVQLRDMASANVTQEGNVLKVSVPNNGTASADASTATPTQANSDKDLPPAPAVDAATTPAANPGAAASAAPETGPSPIADVGTVTPGTSSAADKTAASGTKDKLAKFIDNRETGRFTGKPVTLKVRDADIMDVFRLISDTSGFNIVVGDDVKGRITLSLEGVPWDQALDVILRTQKLGAERNNNILRIITLANLTAEKTAELAAKQASEASAPRITRVFPINYAKLDDLVGILAKLGTASSGAAAVPVGPGAAPVAAPASSSSAVVQVDQRTNSIIVRDTVENVERMRKLIEILDTQTPQVLIEGKVIEATEQFTKGYSGSLGFGSTGTGQYFSSFSGGNPIDPLFSNGGSNAVFSSGSTVAGQTGGGGAFGLSPTLAFLPGNTRLNAILSLSEGESTVKVVSSPKAVVLDKEKASILQSTPVEIVSVATTATGPVTTATIVQANLSMDVTPTVTNEGSVLLQLSLSRDIPTSPPPIGGQPATTAVANRNISTRVLVDSGSTLVMGGIYTRDQTNNSSGFPFLRKIPILGALFGQEQNSDQRTELYFFITPRILNLKESGISG